MNRPAVKSVTLEGENYHVRFREPAQFDEISTPEWAENIADSVASNSKVKMGKRDDRWVVQSVMIRTGSGAENARKLAEKILEEIED